MKSNTYGFGTAISQVCVLATIWCFSSLLLTCCSTACLPGIDAVCLGTFDKNPWMDNSRVILLSSSVVVRRSTSYRPS